jgi:hypothetical protein
MSVKIPRMGNGGSHLRQNVGNVGLVDDEETVNGRRVMVSVVNFVCTFCH